MSLSEIEEKEYEESKDNFRIQQARDALKDREVGLFGQVQASKDLERLVKNNF